MKDFVLITGAYPPDVCGVGDYVGLLMNTQTGKKWEMYYSKDWRFNSILKHIKMLKTINAKYLVMQFPLRSSGWSLVPHLICIYFSWFSSKCFGVVIHEQSQLSLKAYIAEVLILISANKLIFTTEYEQNYAIKRIPLIRKRSKIIKIYSNIKKPKIIKEIEKRNIDIVHFGLFWPNKGIEQFISDVTPLVDSFKVILAGKIPEGLEEYYAKLRKMCEKVKIEIRLNLDDNKISELLNDSKIAYLPFPDGASERRGSMLASMVNGAVVVTRVSKLTTETIINSVVNISKTSLMQILSDYDLLRKKQQAALEYVNTQMPKNADEVASSYDDFMRL